MDVAAFLDESIFCCEATAPQAWVFDEAVDDADAAISKSRRGRLSFAPTTTTTILREPEADEASSKSLSFAPATAVGAAAPRPATRLFRAPTDASIASDGDESFRLERDGDESFRLEREVVGLSTTAPDARPDDDPLRPLGEGFAPMGYDDPAAADGAQILEDDGGAFSDADAASPAEPEARGFFASASAWLRRE